MERFSSSVVILERFSRPPMMRSTASMKSWPYRLLVVTGRYQGSFIAHVGNIGTGKSGGLAGEQIDVDGVVGLDLAQVDVEYGHAVGEVGEVYKICRSKRPARRRGFVKDVCSVGGGEDNDAAVGAEAIHLR